MVTVKSIVKIFRHRLRQLTDAQARALEMTGEALHAEVVPAQVMPFDSGTMQNTNTFVDTSQSKSGTVTLVTQTPYARRLYFHPEYHYSTKENPNAQGKWLEPWLTGDQKDWCQKAFAAFYKREAGV